MCAPTEFLSSIYLDIVSILQPDPKNHWGCCGEQSSAEPLIHPFVPILFYPTVYSIGAIPSSREAYHRVEQLWSVLEVQRTEHYKRGHGTDALVPFPEQVTTNFTTIPGYDFLQPMGF
ncbi:hypothetical protein VTO42DRAFT_5675 [Malbranchea cinnamomea]